MQQDPTLDLANIATSTQADRRSVALLTKTIAELSTQVSTLTAKLATAHSENTRLKKLGHRLALAEHGHRASSNQTPYNQNLPGDRNVYSRSGQKIDPNGYWSSHRFKVEESHTSTTYRYPVHGHNKLATRLDTKGGKTRNKEWINGGPIKWGGGLLDNNIVNMNENYINDIKYTTKCLQTVDGLEVAGTGTGGHYLTLDLPCNNKQLETSTIPILMPNG